MALTEEGEECRLRREQVGDLAITQLAQRRRVSRHILARVLARKPRRVRGAALREEVESRPELRGAQPPDRHRLARQREPLELHKPRLSSVEAAKCVLESPLAQKGTEQTARQQTLGELYFVERRKKRLKRRIEPRMLESV